jgi:hypothetical protein
MEKIFLVELSQMKDGDNMLIKPEKKLVKI